MCDVFVTEMKLLLVCALLALCASVNTRQSLF